MLAYLLVALLGAASAEHSVRMPYLNPAGVTYTYNSGYGPLAYQSYSSVPAVTSTAYGIGPVAGAAYGVAPVAAYAAGPVLPAAYARASIAHATYAAAPVALSAPASAVVPVTKISAQPAVVQDVVDVAQPKVATRRYEIRRPAIQKQFYDIEERTIVRPAGSAVVELETPISANQRGPTKVSPVLSAQPLLKYAPSHTLAYPAPAIPSYLPAAPVHEYPQEFEIQQPIQEQPQALPPLQPSQPAGPEPQLDSSDSVSIDNPEFARTGDRQQIQERFDLRNPIFRSQLTPTPQPAQQPEAPRFPVPLNNQLQRSQIEQQSQLQSSQRSQILSEEQAYIQNARQEQAFLQNARQEQAFLQNARQEQAYIQNARQEQQELASLARSQRPILTPTPEVPQFRGPSTAQPPASLRASLESQSYSQEDVIPSARNLSPEQSNYNQQRLIELLTARGAVTELRSSDEPIRARVLSATPAPPGAAPTDSQVNTRRVVVNRPIQTVQEVDVVEPFTKIERVAVHKPAIVKTAHLEYAHVPATVTAVPALHAVPAAVTPIPALRAVHASVTPLPALHAAVTPAPFSADYY